MSASLIFKQTRDAQWPAPTGATITVEAKSDGSAVSIRWQRDDLARRGVRGEQIVLTLEEFQGIAAALGYRPLG